jgi:micrococcal nuclease
VTQHYKKNVFLSRIDYFYFIMHSPDMSINYPLRVFLTSSIIALILIVGSQPSVQQSLVSFFGLEQIQSVSNKSKTNNINQKSEESKINRVVDGDTAVLKDGRTVRFLNIDTPETKKPETPIMCFGKEASEFTKALVEGQDVTLVSDQEDKDKYGRDLRFIFLKGRNIDDINQSVNALLVQKGFARTVVYEPNDTYKKEFNGYQFEAQKKGLGVWKCPNPFKE